jgi:hypothetical protein
LSTTQFHLWRDRMGFWRAELVWDKGGGGAGEISGGSQQGRHDGWLWLAAVSASIWPRRGGSIGVILWWGLIRANLFKKGVDVGLLCRFWWFGWGFGDSLAVLGGWELGCGSWVEFFGRLKPNSYGWLWVLGDRLLDSEMEFKWNNSRRDHKISQQENTTNYKILGSFGKEVCCE